MTATHADELAFHAALDADPGDSLARMVFADWLEERGDPRADGYRAMGVLERHADRWYGGQYYFGDVRQFPGAASSLPGDWYNALASAQRDFRVDAVAVFDRRSAEDAAAMAFARLPAARRAELLATRHTPEESPNA